jgi:hypothetical protein
MLRWAAGPLPILSHCYLAPVAHLITTLTPNPIQIYATRYVRDYKKAVKNTTS